MCRAYIFKIVLNEKAVSNIFAALGNVTYSRAVFDKRRQCQ